MANEEKGTSFRQRHRLALQVSALIAVLSAPGAMYSAAQAANRPVLWMIVGVVALAMLVAAWAG